MPWTDPVDTDWQTNDVATETMIKTQVLDDLRHLRGQDGITELEGDQNPLVDNNRDLGSALKRWAEIHGIKIHAGRYRSPNFVRETRITWEGAISASSAAAVSNGSGSTGGGGTGQIVLEVNDNAVGDARVDQVGEVGGALDNGWSLSKKPYHRIEFSLNVARANTQLFLGFRATPGAALPVAAEKHAGLRWNAGSWTSVRSDGTTLTAGSALTITDNARHILEVYVVGGATFELWIDGVLVSTASANVPNGGTLEWSELLISDGTGGATQSFLTLGELILQEEVP